jgi:hypothetical protein
VEGFDGLPALSLEQFTRRCYPNKKMIPLLMLFSWYSTAAREGLIQDLQLTYLVRFYEFPPSTFCLSFALYLVDEQFAYPFKDSIVVRLSGAFAILILKLNQSLIFDCKAQEVVY